MLMMQGFAKKLGVFCLLFTKIMIYSTYAETGQTGAFVDSDRICGYWALDPNVVGNERDLRIQCYTITQEEFEDHYNKYIGRISINIGGGADRYDIIHIEKRATDEYILDLGITYGGRGDGIPIIAYGSIRLQFINSDTIYFEIIDHDQDGGWFKYDFIGSNVLCYRAALDNNIERQDEDLPLPYTATHIVTEDHIPLYHDRPPINNEIVIYLNKNDAVQVIKSKILSTRLHLEYQPVTRDGITAPLVYVRTADGKRGFCFLIYLNQQPHGRAAGY
jgi:hypothetical protein